MGLSEKVQELQQISQSIIRHQNIRNIGYLLIPIIIGIFVVILVNKKLKQLVDRRHILVQEIGYDTQVTFNQLLEWQRSIIESNTYLIYHKKADYLDKCGIFLRNITFLSGQNQLFSKESNEFFIFSRESVLTYKNQVDNYNENFVQKRLLEYQNLFEKSPFPLDENQRRAVIVDDTHNLVIAGAGSGKTEVLITRIAYLIHRKPDTIRPERILALAFQNKAAKEIRTRLQERFGVDVKIKTFHSLGKEILEHASETVPQMMFPGNNPEIQYQNFIKTLFDEMNKDPAFQKNILKYVLYFGDNFIVKGEADFSKKEEYFQYISGLSYTALNGIKVKSEAERVILNYLLTHTVNGKHISVRYESPATWMAYLDASGKKKNPRPDFFLPEYKIYIEHWAVNKDGKVPAWFSGEDASKKYVTFMRKKKERLLHQKEYTLLETFHWEFREDDFLDKFQKKMLQALREKYPNKEFTIEELSYDEIVKNVWRDCKESIDDLSKNVANFILIAKTYHLMPADIRARLSNEPWTRRQQAFAAVSVKIYERYEHELRSKNCIDFSDMINLAIHELTTKSDLYRNTFDHILIDEYQDISTQRYDLIKALIAKNEGCKLFCVGDDWQSIMGFSGSNLNLFVNFPDYFDHPARTDLTVNYRSCKSIVELGAAIIQKNGDAQIKKETIAHNPSERQIKVYSSTLDPRDYKEYYQQFMRHCVEMIEEYLAQGYRPEDILILARIVKPKVIKGNLLDYAKIREVPISTELNNPNKIHLISIHKSKGLQARVVFILDVVKGLYGLPCELENPDIYEPAIMGPKRQREEEERRVFYVAATRAKEDLIIYTQKYAMSEFLREIKEHVTVEEI